MQGSAQPEDRFASAAGGNRSLSGSIDDRRPDSGGKLEEHELDSALQLLVERARYITGATGSALALPQGEEMVCRASAGFSAPAIGARLQVRSGLTGESIVRRQLLRCDNAEADPRVNIEACRSLGIASIVVLPLLRQNGEVRGLFELFSDHPYAFEERDLIALERMADLTVTALDLAEQRQSSAHVPAPRQVIEKPAEVSAPASAATVPAISIQPEVQPEIQPKAASLPVSPAGEPPQVASSPTSAGAATAPAPALPAAPTAIPAAVPEAMLRVQKCASCGFPVSEGRSLCLDCEKKEEAREKEGREKERRIEPAAGVTAPEVPPGDLEVDSGPEVEGEFVRAFLANSVPIKESWAANHVNLLAVIVLILGILVAVVVFR